MEVVNQLLTVNRSSEPAKSLKSQIQIAQLKYDASLIAGVDVFSSVYDPSLYASLQLSRNNRWGSSIVRINLANRFQTVGIHGEIDLYPSITDGVYGYLNYGFSRSSLFPAHRIGAEIYSKLPKSFEGSVGGRYLYFDDNRQVLIYTGSIGWYHKNLWFSLRPYVTPDINAGTSFSLGLDIRRYFSTLTTYLSLRGRYGYSPDFPGTSGDSFRVHLST